MPRVTLRQVISAVKRLRRGKRGVRLNDVVDYIRENLRQRAVWKALTVAVRNGTVERKGNRFRLKKVAGERRKSLGKRFKTASKRNPALVCTQRSRKMKLTPQNNKYSGRSQSEETSECSEDREKRRNWRRQKRFSSSSTPRTGTSKRTSRSTMRSTSQGQRDRSSSSSKSEDFSTDNSRLVSTRDSVELLRERMSQKTSGNRVSFERSNEDVSPCSATSIFPSFRW